QDDAFAIWEGDLVHLRLDVVPLEIAQARYLDLIVEVADVGDDGAVLHGPHVVKRDDIFIAGRCDEDIGARRGVLPGGHLIALHGRLQRADWVDLRYQHAAAGLAQGRRRTLAHIAVTRDHGHLAGHHHVGTAADAVDQRLAAAVEVVELGFGHAVVDVDGGPQQRALLLHLVKPADTRGGLLRNAPDRATP